MIYIYLLNFFLFWYKINIIVKKGEIFLKSKALIISLIIFIFLFIGLIVLTLINMGAFQKPAKKISINTYLNVKDSSSNNDLSDTDSSISNSNNSSSSDGIVSVNFKTSNSWSDDTKNNVQFDAKILNKTDNEVSDWKVEVTLPEGTDITQVWNVSYVKDGNKFTFSPVTHNQKVVAGSDVTFGFIASGTKDIGISNARVVTK